MSERFGLRLALLASTLALIACTNRRLDHPQESRSDAFYTNIIKNMENVASLLADPPTMTMRNVTILGHQLSLYDAVSSSTVPFVADEINQGCYKLQDILKAGSIKPGDTLLDLGTNVGTTAVLLAKMFPGVRVIGVEPVPFNYVAALANAKLNGVDHSVTILNAALASKVTTTRILYDAGNSGGSYTSTQGADHTKQIFGVNTIRVSDIMTHFSVKQTPFIKLDCEGCEWDVVPSLTGAAAKMFENAFVAGELHHGHENAKLLAPELVKYVEKSLNDVCS